MSLRDGGEISIERGNHKISRAKQPNGFIGGPSSIEGKRPGKETEKTDCDESYTYMTVGFELYSHVLSNLPFARNNA